MPDNIFDNKSSILKDDLVKRLRAGDRISIAAAYFSIYGFEELREQLEACEEFRFIYTEPTFLSNKADKAQREFYIPRLNRERSLYGTKFEIKLRNELTQRAIARECADWMRAKARFKSFSTPQFMQPFFEVEGDGASYVYMPFDGLTTTGLGSKPGATSYTMINRLDAPMSQSYLELFDRAWEDDGNLQDVTDEVIESISNVYKENAPETIYYLALFNIFNEFLEDISEDVLPNVNQGVNIQKRNQLHPFYLVFVKDTGDVLHGHLDPQGRPRRLRADKLPGGEVMLGLPSTTEVGKRLPKEAFYRNLKLDRKTYDEFVMLIDRITMANTVKPTTANFADGRNVHEIMFLAIDLKGSDAPLRAIEAIAKLNPHKLVFHLKSLSATYLVHAGTHLSNTIERVVLVGPSLDEAWCSIVSQVVFGEVDGKDVDARIERAKRRAAFEKEKSSLDKKCRREQQISKRNELFSRLKAKQKALAELDGGERRV